MVWGMLAAFRCHGDDGQMLHCVLRASCVYCTSMRLFEYACICLRECACMCPAPASANMSKYLVGVGDILMFRNNKSSPLLPCQCAFMCTVRAALLRKSMLRFTQLCTGTVWNLSSKRISPSKCHFSNVLSFIRTGVCPCVHSIQVYVCMCTGL